MPRTHPRHKKRDVLELLALDLPIHLIQARTGIAQRTLYRWKKQMRKKQQRQMAKKDAAFVAKLSQNSDFCHKWQPRPASKGPDPCQKVPPDDDQLAHNDLPDPHASQSAISNEDDLKFVRSQLMNVVRDIAAGLEHNSPDLNTHSLALSRLLDRIKWLDQLIELEESKADAKPVTEAVSHDFPGWLRLPPHRNDEQRAAEEAEIARRRAWAESQFGEDEWGPKQQ